MAKKFMNLFGKPLEPEVQELVDSRRPKEPYLGWTTGLIAGCAIFLIGSEMRIDAVMLRNRQDRKQR